jgi:hypothetical protein
MMKTISIAVFAIFMLSSCIQPGQSEAPIELISIETLLANPTLYDGKLVKIQGAAVVRFEGNFVCPDAVMIDSGDSKKCLWLSSGSIGNKAFDLSPFHGKVVEFTGNFDSKNQGHMGSYGAAIWPIKGKVLGSHGRGNVPEPPPPPQASSSNYSIKATTVEKPFSNLATIPVAPYFSC